MKNTILLHLLLASGLLGHASAELQPAGNGSGFFITGDGYFVTNEHVVNGVDGIKIKWDGRLLDAVVVKVDSLNDVAIFIGGWRGVPEPAAWWGPCGAAG